MPSPYATAHYKAMRRLYQQGYHLCWMCQERLGLSPDHYPPLSDFSNPMHWTGQLLPSCTPCQRKQGARITNSRGKSSWVW